MRRVLKRSAQRYRSLFPAAPQYLPLKNITFNFAGQFYSTAVGIVTLPLLLSYVGAEGFGLIGFFAVLQSLMALLDAGLLPALGRAIARLKVSTSDSWRLRTLVNSVELAFAGVALLFCLALVLCTRWIAEEWLSLKGLPVDLVSDALGVMIATLGLRWMSAFNRSGIIAHEDQVWLNVFDILIATLRFPAAILVVHLEDGNLIAYFAYQAAVALLELIGLRWRLRLLLPGKTAATRRFSFSEIRRVMPFASGIAYSTIVWILVTQLDRLILSRVLSLSEYGYFVLTVTITAGIAMLTTPVSRAILPRMTSLLASGGERGMLAVYRSSTRYVVCLSAPVTLIIALWPYHIIVAWTGDAAAAEWATEILPLYAMGGGIVSLTTFQYFLQYAYGNLKLMTRFNNFSLLVNVPLIIYFAIEHGAIGVAWVWFGFRFFSLLVWVPVVHSSLAPGIHLRWLFLDVMPPFTLCLATTLSAYYFFSPSIDTSRIELIIFFSATAVLAFGAGLLAVLLSPRVQDQHSVT